MGVNRVCRLCAISKATYYNNKQPNDRLLAKYENVKKYVEKIIVKNSSYGIKRIKKSLREKYQIEIGRNILGKLLILWGLSLKRKINRPKISLIKKILIKLSDKVNLLIRTEITEPLQAVTSDITEIIHKNGKSYLSVHKDIFGQMVYGFATSQTMDAELVKSSLNKANKTIKKLAKKFARKNRDKILFHQDQGSQYTGYEYVEEVLKNKNSRLSYSTPGTPTENHGQESFFGRFKEEWASEIKEIETFAEVERFIKKKIRYYNRERIHTSIGYASPYSFTKDFFKKCYLAGDVKNFSFQDRL